jgi:hypothetical protein
MGNSQDSSETLSSETLSAGIAILEYFDYDPTPITKENYDGPASQKVRGVCRLVQSTAQDDTVLLDLTIKDPSPKRSSSNDGNKRYEVYISIGISLIIVSNVYSDKYSSGGDMTNPPETTGKPLRVLGTITIDPVTGYGDLVCEISGLKIWEVVGRGQSSLYHRNRNRHLRSPCQE